MENLKELVASMCDVPFEVNENLNVIQELDNKSCSLRVHIEQEFRALNAIAGSANKQKYVRYLVKKAKKCIRKKNDLMATTLALVDRSIHDVNGHIKGLRDAYENHGEVLKRHDEDATRDENRIDPSFCATSGGVERSGNVKRVEENNVEALRQHENESSRNEHNSQQMYGRSEASTSAGTRCGSSTTSTLVREHVNQRTESVKKSVLTTPQNTSTRGTSTKHNTKRSSDDKRTGLKNKNVKRNRKSTENQCTGQENSRKLGQFKDETEEKRVRGEQSVDATQVSEQQRYCVCKRVSFGNMVGCENETCPIQWFHFECVGLTSPPIEDWYCPFCK